MKTVKQTMLVVLGLLFFALQGCSHDDYIPVPGEPGADGTDGVSGTASCESCHSVEHKTPINGAYSLSTHFTGTTVARGTGATTTFSDGSINSGSAQFCSQCHTSEGYIDNAKAGKPNPAGYSLTTKISCEACHGNTHRSFNFTTDGNDFGLRRIFAVPYLSGSAGSTLDASLTGKMSTSNTCIPCHQVRPSDGISTFWKIPNIDLAEKEMVLTPVLNSSGVVVDLVVKEGNPVINNTPSGLTYKFYSIRNRNRAVLGYPASTLLSGSITTTPPTAVYSNYRTYFNGDTQRNPGAHDGPQGDIWMGKSGQAIAGSATTLPDSKTAVSHYSKGVSCVSCHMDKPKADGTHGSHSLEASFVSCTPCHGAGGAETKLAALNTFTDAEMIKLANAFKNYPNYFKVTPPAAGSKNVIPTVVLNLSTDDTGAAWPTSLANGPLVDPTKPLITTTTWNVSKTIPLKYAQAFWNYKLLTARQGSSDGTTKPSHNAVHNPSYFKALIQNSIEALQ